MDGRADYSPEVMPNITGHTNEIPSDTAAATIDVRRLFPDRLGGRAEGKGIW
jgi:hypothetical protein